jgi:O-antigen ligase
MALLVWQHRPLDKRIDVSMGLFSENWQEINRATAHRLPIWRTAIHMFEHNWINGVGPRGFRYVYAKYAAPNDFYLRDGRHGQTHPHQFVLEVAADTGVIGLVGFALFWVVLIRFGRRVMRERPDAVPWLLSVAVAWFPLNAHMALYASYWSSVAWWLLGAAVAVWRRPCAQS